LTANHNSILTLLLGIPFERALKYHKISGYLAFINGIFHTYVAYVHPPESTMYSTSPTSLDHNTSSSFWHFTIDGQIRMSGTFILSIIFLMIVTASRPIRRLFFEVFFYFHLAFAFSMVVCAFYHSGVFVVILASIFWGGDLICRKIIMALVRYPRKASINIIADTVVEIKFPKIRGFDYNPGQYVFLALPELSVFQWHPFSISSSPHQDTVTLHIAKQGYWTSRLFEIAEKKDEVSILVEGPYGSLGVDLMSNRYKMVVCLSGGIGVTPMQSICHQLMHEADQGDRQLKKIWFVWASREPDVMENMDITKHGHKYKTSQSNDSCSFTDELIEESDFEKVEEEMQQDSNISPSISDEKLDVLGDMDVVQNHNDVFVENDASLENEILKTDQTFLEDGTSCHVSIDKKMETTNSSAESCADEDSLLELDFFLTNKDVKDDMQGNLPFLNSGRPDLKELFENMRNEAIMMGEKRVAVCVCASKIFVDICRHACIKYSNQKVRFDFHSETFD